MNGRTRGQGAKTPERRAAIARAALDIVTEVGHRALTTAEVAARAGLSERAMLYHFPTRDHLLVAALEPADADRADHYIAEHAAAATVRLEGMAEDFASAAVRNDHVIRLMAAMTAAATDDTHPAHAYFLSHHAQALAGLALVVRAEQQAGVAHPELDPEETARQLLGMWLGLESLWLLRQDFDLVASLTSAFRRITGRPLMEQRALLDRVVGSI